MSKIIQLLLGAILLTAVAVAADCAAIALKAIPQCAQSCFINGAPTIGCGSLDFACQCASEAKLYAAIEGCVAQGCPAPSYQAVIDGASSVCGCATAGVAVGGSMTVSGISEITVIPGTVVSGTVAPVTVIPGSFTTTAPVSTTAAATTKGSSSSPTTSANPITSAANTAPFGTSVATFAPTASVVHAGSGRASVGFMGCVIAGLVMGLVWL
ncbi:MAC1 interacting protein 1 [Coniochaeta sp. 2T2.1]|nr:MAC1 interacting protein 1 [Coniochaeta sp. 2T2.1]